MLQFKQMEKATLKFMYYVVKAAKVSRSTISFSFRNWFLICFFRLPVQLQGSLFTLIRAMQDAAAPPTHVRGSLPA